MPKLSIQEVFDLDPLKLTRENIDDVIEYYRVRRAQFKAGKTNAGAAKLLTEAIDLEELGLWPKKSGKNT